MTTVAQLIDYLQTLPPQTEVEVMVEHSRDYSTSVISVPLDINQNSDYFDGVLNPYVASNSPLFNRRILTFGS